MRRTYRITEIGSTLASAGREDLVEEIQALGDNHQQVLRELEELTRRLSAMKDARAVLTSTEAAKELGVSSPNTVKNWLEGGFFPGAFRTKGGHWRFPRDEVIAVKRRMAELRTRNTQRDLLPPDADDAEEPPLL